MKSLKIPVQCITRLAGADMKNRDIGTFLLDIWAEVRDVDVNNRLLKSLILRYAAVENQMRALNSELASRQKAMLEDLAAAASIQKTLLPGSLPSSELVEAAFEFLPCDQVGGDLVNLVRHDDENWYAWVVDVAGHGPRAAMITVAVAQFLQTATNNQLQPAEVMKALDKEFPFTRFGSFFTIIFGVVNPARQTFTYCNSGHPNPVLLQPGQAPVFIEGNGPMLGLGIPMPWNEITVDFSAGKSLLIYTDGLVECADADGMLFGEDRLLQMLNRLQYQTAPCLSTSIMNEMKTFMGNVKFQDDFTFLALKSKI
ncbi:MAG: SpoIIE family protein phosphatase [Candidatus Riflebacteria bacterium]|nr:SpoIIE family protein phosphatase [Candidatus Riflebacteria bacterium]